MLANFFTFCGQNVYKCDIRTSCGSINKQSNMHINRGMEFKRFPPEQRLAENIMVLFVS